MSEKFTKERNQVLKAAKNGIVGNIKLSATQKKYVKNLLLFALMNASDNETVTNSNFIKLVNKLFKGFLIKIIKESFDDDDDDTDFETALEVELNKIMADKNLLALKDLAEILTPEKIMGFLKNNTNGLSQRQILNHLRMLRDAKANYRETPAEERQRKKRQKEYEMQQTRQRMMEAHILTHGDRSRS